MGAATADLLACAESQLLVSGGNRSRLEEVADRTSAWAMRADLATIADSNHLASEAPSAAGGIELLVAGTGVGWAVAFASMMPPARAEEVLMINLVSAIHPALLLLPQQLGRGWGQLVLVGSIPGGVGVGGEAMCAAVKAGFSASAGALRGTGIRITHVVIGAAGTHPSPARRALARSRPRLTPQDPVASVICDSVLRGRNDVYILGWMRLPGVIRVTAPFPYRRPAFRFG